MYWNIRKKWVKKNVNPYKPSAFLWVIDSLVHSNDPDQTPQSAEYDHGLYWLFTDY